MTATFHFAGQTAIVTGAGSGIGARMAAQLHAAGATVYAVDIDPTGAPSGTVGIRADVSDLGSMSAVVDDAIARTGRIDVICNNAGINAFTELLDATVDEWDRIMAVNARGVFIGMKLVMPHMIAAGRGAIVNTASTAAVIGIRDRATYSASKGAVVALTRQVAVQYAAKGVRCNCICPGTVNSPMVAEVIAATADPGATRTMMEIRQPLGRMAGPDEIAAVAVFLASEHASFITGVALNVDGGWTAA
jgi:NAD(P)-dependent dehydrogenase (short-subunit alcohol dehydrogenase family)